MNQEVSSMNHSKGMNKQIKVCLSQKFQMLIITIHFRVIKIHIEVKINPYGTIKIHINSKVEHNKILTMQIEILEELISLEIGKMRI